MYDRKREEWLHDTEHAVSLFGETIMLGELWCRQDDTHVQLKEMNDIVAMQFTGLLDKNGKEIYDGDILKVRKELVGMFPVNDLENDFNIVCKYRGASFYPLELVGENSVEIIGNIYQNNDLLK